MTNPFTLPGRDVPPDHAICPWRYPEHDGWHVDVDSFGEQLRQFDPVAADRDRLVRRGRLVIVTGPSRCGKSSLLHICAFRLALRANTRAEPADYIVDLSGRDHLSDPHDAGPPRINYMCERTLRHLEQRSPIEVPRGLDALLRTQGYGKFLDRLSDLSQRLHFTLIILLPPLFDFVKETKEYYSLSLDTPGLVFMGESRSPDIARYSADQADRSDLVSLRVSPINTEDGWKVVSQRTGPPGSAPTTTREEVERAVQYIQKHIGAVSIELLNKCLHAAWQRHLDAQSAGVVRWRDITRPVREGFRYIDERRGGG